MTRKACWGVTLSSAFGGRAGASRCSQWERPFLAECVAGQRPRILKEPSALRDLQAGQFFQVLGMGAPVKGKVREVG